MKLIKLSQKELEETDGGVTGEILAKLEAMKKAIDNAKLRAVVIKPPITRPVEPTPTE